MGFPWGNIASSDGQFDIYALPDLNMLLVDLQSGAVDEFNTRLLAPLLPVDPGLKAIRRVNRELTFNSKVYVFMQQLMSAVRVRDLGDPLGNIADQRDRIVGALDVPFCRHLIGQPPVHRNLSTLNKVECDPISR